MRNPATPGPQPKDPGESAGEPADLRAALAAAQAKLATIQAEKDHILAELALRDRAINATTSGITVLDVSKPGYPIAFINQAIEKRTGYTSAEVIGRDGLKFITDAGDQASAEKIRQAMAVGGETRLEVQVCRKDGSTYWSGMFVGPVRDTHGKITHYIAVSADITARMEADRKREELQRQLEHEMQERERVESELKLSQKLEAIGQLAAGIAHEINTPIQYVGDSAHFLRSALGDIEQVLKSYREELGRLGPDPQAVAVLERIRAAETAADLDFLQEEIPRAFDRMLDGVERVTKIVRAMKEFAHPHTEEQSPADLNHALETTLVVANNEYKYAATAQTQFADLPPVKCNVGELNQVFLNLIVNAAHAMAAAGKDSASGRIVLATAVAGDMVEISIEDNGCGIPPENLSKIFDPFFTTKEVGKGTGQGLAIARQIVVDRHGGALDVDSTVGSGTRFTIRLPINGRPPKAAA